MPNDVRLKVSRKIKKTDDTDWTLENLLEVLKDEVEARERVGLYVQLQERRPANYGHYNRNPPRTLFVGDNKNIVSCSFCHGSHASVSCNNVTNVQERKNILRRQGRCYICLRRGGHLACDCQSTIKCYKCGARHHVALCDKMERDTVTKIQSALNPTASTFEKATKSEVNMTRSEEDSLKEHKDGVPKVVTTSHVKSYDPSEGTKSSSILLQTANCVISDPSNSRGERVTIRVMFDMASQRTYLVENVTKQIGLPPLYKDNIVINVFGNTTSNVRIFSL